MTVTLLGWLIFLKGLVLVAVSSNIVSMAVGQLHYADHFYLYLAPSLAIGAYLTLAGFTAPLRGR